MRGVNKHLKRWRKPFRRLKYAPPKVYFAFSTQFQVLEERKLEILNPTEPQDGIHLNQDISQSEGNLGQKDAQRSETDKDKVLDPASQRLNGAEYQEQTKIQSAHTT